MFLLSCIFDLNFKFDLQTWFLPRLVDRCHPNHGVQYDDIDCVAIEKRPKQRNCDDCGIFVMKYMDFLLQGYDITSLDSWSQELVETFRYRIAKDLQRGKATPIPGVRMRIRNGNA